MKPFLLILSIALAYHSNSPKPPLFNFKIRHFHATRFDPKTDRYVKVIEANPINGYIKMTGNILTISAGKIHHYTQLRLSSTQDTPVGKSYFYIATEGEYKFCNIEISTVEISTPKRISISVSKGSYDKPPYLTSTVYYNLRNIH